MLTVRLTCSRCGEELPLIHENDFLWSREYHDCFGERVGSVALVSEQGLSLTKDGIDLEVIDVE